MSRSRLNLIFTLMVLFIFAFALPVFGEHKWGKVTDQEWNAAAPEVYPEANAVILFDVGKYEIRKDVIEIYRHVRIKVLNDAGVEEVGEQSIRYYDEREKLKSLDAQIITPDGKKHKVEKDAMFEKTSGSYKTKTFAFPQLAPGVIAEYKYNIRSTRWQYITPWYFQNYIFTMSSEIELKLHPGFAYDIEYYNVPFDKQKAEIEEHSDPESPLGTQLKIITYRWNRQNLMPIKDEPYMSCVKDYCSAIRFQLLKYESPYSVQLFFKNWQETGKEFQDYLDDYCNRGGDIKKLAEEVTSGAADDGEKSKKLFNYVMNNYETSDEYTGKRFNNEHISDLLENKIGFPEDKNILLVEMHKALEIPAWPVLISTRDNSKFNPKCPGLLQFNHLIAFVQVGDGWEFLDASGKYSPYGLLPPDCLTDGGFLIDGQQSDLVRISIKPANSIRIDTTWMQVDVEGLVSCSTSCRFGGYTASLYGERYNTKAPDEFMNDYFMDRIEQGCRLGNHNCHKDTLDNLMLTMDFSSDELAEILDNNLIVKPVSFAWRENPFKSEHRFVPVDFIHPLAYRNVVIISSATPAVDYILPKDVQHQLDGIYFERKTAIENNQIVIKSSLEILRPQFGTNEYSGLKEFFDKVALTTADDVTLVLAGGDTE